MTYAKPSQPTHRNADTYRNSAGAHAIGQRARFSAAIAALLAATALAALVAPPAGAISDTEELVRIGGQGEGAGELSFPSGLGSDPVTGHLYVTDYANNRISEFTPWGSFVKAFGWDVAPGAVNEQQEVRVRASEGQFTLSFDGSTTTDLAFDAPGSAGEGPGSVEAALNALASIGGAGGEVSVEAVPGTADGKTPTVYVVAFKGLLAATNVDELTVANGTTSLDGGVPTTSLEVRTRADGTAGGTGLESCTAESGCKAGLAGSGAGQFANAFGIAVDAAGNLYVLDQGNNRVQKFDSAGRFVLSFGGEVDKTTSANLCTAASTHECGIGIIGNGPGEFGGVIGEGLTLCPPGPLCPSGALFVADSERIQRFGLDGAYESELAVPGKVVRAVAFDPVSKDLYATYAGEDGVHKLDSTTGAEILTQPLKGDGPVATDAAGSLFTRSEIKVLQYDSTGKPLSPPSCCESPLLPPPNPFEHRFNLLTLGTNAAGDLHVAYFGSGVDSFIRAFGPGPVIFEGPPPLAPTISAQFATSVQRDEATVGAEINPHFFTDTRFYVQYGTGKCTEDGCSQEQPLPPGALLTTNPINGAVKSTGVFLEGLKPGTTYHYRFVAESLGGGPVYGVDPDGPGGPAQASPGEGLEASFVTPDPIAPKACANDLFRGGFAAKLPDCRAYEMVSPIDKNNGDIKTLVNFSNYSSSVSQSAEDGGRMAYSSYRAFADPKGAPYTDQLLATRGEDGWRSESIDAPQGPAANLNLNTLGNTYKGFTPDLCSGWLVVAAEPQLDPPRDAEDYPNLYRRQTCGAGNGSFEALVGVEPTVPRNFFYPEPQGASADGEAAIFRVQDKLTEDAASGVWQAYYTSEGNLKLLCVLPSGVPSTGNCSGGTGGKPPFFYLLGRLANVANAISTDGSHAYWTASGSEESGPGKVYLRLNPGEEQSEVSGGECTEPEKACTLKVSETASSKASRFLVASPDGTRALFEVSEGTQKGNLYLFDAEAGESTLIAKKALGLAGAGEDLARIYFVSEEVLAEGATAKEPNLYLQEEEENTFIATLSEADASPAELTTSVTAREPIYHAARASADGSALAFVSNASPTGYDNTDQATGRALSEVYLYRVGSGGPVCVSCNPSGARPQGQMVRLVNVQDPAVPMAASLPLPTTMLHDPRALSTAGKRLFFNSYDALLPRDTNGKADVYMWESAESKAACTALGAELYLPSAAGCLSLISNGESPENSEFLDASANGDDAFFLTNAGLLPQDPGLFDVYDARVGGGLPPPPTPTPDCQGDICKAPVSAPDDPTPASTSFHATDQSTKPRCAKGKARRKGRCVAKKAKKAKRGAQHKRAANHNRGAGR